ncbi:hypothetical protein OG936_37095 [Streptomyces sp. NBC_00846]|uniref:hypothetical protein n=1 Tax=Streptomyces sp. NBC_00846 TaxID=2975849 RepID=UPI00386E1097|nr:hypothetical protein OG936_24960 [Streptomyces sp. NBC_00846]WTA40247.1 hypothetical protein OG936_37095 [Streptomyces sp. NBC_00846]
MVVLEACEAEQLVSVLDRWDDWLLHAQPDTLEDMVEFLGPECLGRTAAEGIVEVLDFYSAQLNRRLRSMQVNG